MPVYVFVDRNQAPQPGTRERFAVFHPGDLSQVVAWAKQIGMGGSHQHFQIYSPEQLGNNAPCILAIQVAMGVPVTVQQPQLSATHVQGGQPAGVPAAQPGQHHPGGQIDPYSKFEELPDEALTAGRDAMFGELNDGTITDLVATPMGMDEQPREP